MPDKSIEIGRVERTKGTKLVVSVGLWKGQVNVDLREWLETPDYTGWTKKGVRAKPEIMEKVVGLLQEAVEKGAQLSAKEAPREPRKSTPAGISSARIDRLILSRSLGEDVGTIAKEAGVSEDDVWQLLEEHAEQCPNCGSELPSEGDRAYVCTHCSDLKPRSHE